MQLSCSLKLVLCTWLAGALDEVFWYTGCGAEQGALCDSAAHLPDAAWKPMLRQVQPAVCLSEKEASSLFLGHPLCTHTHLFAFGN